MRRVGFPVGVVDGQLAPVHRGRDGRRQQAVGADPPFQERFQGGQAGHHAGGDGFFDAARVHVRTRGQPRVGEGEQHGQRGH